MHFEQESLRGRWVWIVALGLIAVTCAAWGILTQHQFHFRLASEWAIFLVVLTLLPPLGLWLGFSRIAGQVDTWLAIGRRESMLARIAVATSCVFIVVFVIYFGNRQYGAWDFNVAVDTGWREISGQRPYVDFLTPNPPGFNLGMWYAFRLFGVSWNAQLIWTALVAVITFAWSLIVCRSLTMRPLAAWSTAFVLQALTFLPTDFWWYNNVTAILGCIFLLSIYLCMLQEIYRVGPWLSYAIALGLLALQKPNIAGLLILGGATLLCVAAPPPRRKAAFWTATGGALAIAILLVHHVSIPAMIAAYRAAAIERGWKAFALRDLRWPNLVQIAVVPAICSLPVLVLAPSLWRAAKCRDWRAAARYALFLLPIPVAIYGIRTNADFPEMNSSFIIVAAATAVFVLRRGRRRMASFLIAVEVVLFITMSIYGRTRERVHGIGQDVFYEPTINHLRVGDAFFSSLTATPRMLRVQTEAHRLVGHLPGPIFFGPRLEYEYADLRLPSPLHWPVYYHPGTAFARRDMGRLNERWEKEQFQTLVFLGDDRTYYPPELISIINREYERVPGFTELEVYERRQP